MIFCCVGRAASNGLAHQRQHIGHVLHVFLACFFRGVAGAKVIVALGQTQAALNPPAICPDASLKSCSSPVPKKCIHVDQLVVSQQRS